MNPEADPSVPPVFPPRPPGLSPIDWRYWAKRLLVCNPFFLCSAAVLLFGVNRLAIDEGFLGGSETPKLLFNFFALQIYELIVIATAVVLARRKIWYDSALLVMLDNGLLLVPLMLMSQAVLVGWSVTCGLSLAGAGLVALRYVAVRKGYPKFNLPGRALELGGGLLLLNFALPVVFRIVMREDYENWATPNLFLWMIALPLLAAGANFLPRPVRCGGLGPERQWLPLLIFALWIAGTAVHVWCIGYVSHLPLRLFHLAPLACAVAWTMVNRIRDCVPQPGKIWRGAMLLLVFGSSLFALEKPTVFFPLAIMNLLGFAALALKGTVEFRLMARGFALASLSLLLVGVPCEWFATIHPLFVRVDPPLAGIITFIAGAAFRSTRINAGLCGAWAVAMGVGGVMPVGSGHAAIQAGAVFLFIHSLRWIDDGRSHVSWARWSLAAFWISDAWLWAHGLQALPVRLILVGAGLVALAAAARWLRWKLPPPRALVAGCVGVGFAAPGNWFFTYGRAGMVALAVSLLLFAIGTALAWTRDRWERRLHPCGASMRNE